LGNITGGTVPGSFLLLLVGWPSHRQKIIVVPNVERKRKKRNIGLKRIEAKQSVGGLKGAFFGWVGSNADKKPESIDRSINRQNTNYYSYSYSSK
jgi:hypothetical protein